MTVLDRFDVLARLVEASQEGLSEDEAVAYAAKVCGTTQTRATSVLLLARELGFLSTPPTLAPTAAGRKFANYMSVYRTEAREEAGPTGERRASDYQVCMTLPPAWRARFRESLGELVQATDVGERFVVEGSRRRLYIVSPFVDPSVLQLKLADVHMPNVHVTVLTSDSKIAREYPEGNFHRRRLVEVLARRFGEVDVCFYEDAGAIVHAKLWLSEGGFFVTSANLKGNSAADNVELGLFSADPGLTRTLTLALEKTLQMEGVTWLEP